MRKEHVLLFLLIVSLDFFLFMPYENLGISRIVKSGIILYLMLACVSKRYNEDQDDTDENRVLLFKREIILLIILPFVSGISSYIYRGQPILISWMAARNSLYFLLYFYLHKIRITSLDLINVVVIIAFISCLIYVGQQIAYPSIFLFNETQNADEVEIRNGFYRFRLFSLNPYIYFAFFYSLYCFMLAESKKINYLPSLLLFFVGVFLTLTRQVYVCIFIPALFYSLFDGEQLNIKKIVGFVFGLLILYIVYLNLESILGADMIERTQSESEDNIRYLSYYYYGIEYWQDNLNMVFGNGVPSWGNSIYGNEMQDIEEVSHLYRSDIGVVGTFSTYGIAYLVAIVLTYWKVFKNFRLIPTYLRLLIIASIINLPLACWLEPEMGLYMSVIFYLIDMNVTERLACHSAYNNDIGIKSIELDVVK